MTGSSPNPETTASDKEWQEFYLLNTVGIFKKYRKIIEIIGTCYSRRGKTFANLTR